MYSSNKVQQQMAKRIFLHKLEECEKYPKYIQIEPTEQCNARCSMCTKSITLNKHVSTMSDELFEKICKEIKSYVDWIEMVTIQWMGEPLLDQQLEKKIVRLKEIGIKEVSFSTNASLLSKERCKQLIEAGLDDLRLSIDSVHKKTYERIRYGLKYDEVMSNAIAAFEIRDTLNPKMKMRVRMVDLEETHGEIEEWRAYWKKYIKENDFAQVMPRLSKWDERINNFIEIGEMPPCISLFSTIVINSEGKVALCCIDSELEEIMGDVNEHSIKKIWNNEKFEEYRRRHLDENRKDIELCQGCNCWNRY